MAFIIKGVVLNSGIEIESTYARIEQINGNKNWVHLTLNYYMDKEFADEGKSCLYSYDFSMSQSVEDNASNFMKQGYEYLKTLPEFSEVVDV